MKEMKRFLSLFLCLVMLVGCLPANAFADEVAQTQQATQPVVETVAEDSADETGSADETTTNPEETTVDETTPDEGAVIPGESTDATEGEDVVPGGDGVDEEEIPEETEAKKPVRPGRPVIVQQVTDEAMSGDTALAANETVVVIAGSDYQKHGNTVPKNNTQNILEAIQEDYATADGFLFGGDYSQTINDSRATTSGINELKSVVQGVYGDGMNEVYVQGNHDAAVSGLTATDAHDTDDYGVFSINEDDFPSGGQVNSDMLTKLENYLNTKANEKYSKPIFVVTHLPLHKTSRYDSVGTGAAIFNVLNEAGGKGLNIIFLFGHNHSQGYDAYLGNGSIYLPKGSEILVDDGSTSTLNFTYMNYGYVGYVTGSACTHLTMTTFEITDSEVIVKRYDADGEHTCGGTAGVLKAAGVTSGSYTADTTVVKSGATITLTAPTTGDDDDNEGGTTAPTQPSTETDASGMVSVTAPGVTAVTVNKSTLAGVDTSAYSSYARYDITLEGYTDGDEATVTIRLDEADGFRNGAAVVLDVEKNVTIDVVIANGAVTFKTTHFSEYDVMQTAETVEGNATVNTAEDGSWQTVTMSGTTTETKTKTVYVLSSGNPSGSVLIADRNTAGDVHLVANDGSNVAVTSTKVIYGDCDGDGDSEYYIELTDAQATDSVWTVGKGYTFSNQGKHLYRASSYGGTTPRIDNSSTSWSYSTDNHRLSYQYDSGFYNSTYYLYYSSGRWNVSTSDSNADELYFYTPQTVEYVEEDSNTTTYAVTAEDVEYFVSDNRTASITKSVTEGTPAGTYKYDIVKNDDSIISSIDGNGTITFTGIKGTAQVKVSYSWTQGENTFTIWDTIDVTAKGPYFRVELCDAVTVDGTTTYEPITAPIVKKGVVAGQTYPLWAVVKEYNAQNPEGEDLGDVEDTRLRWVVSDTSIATIDPATGVLTFTGTSFGSFDVTVYYLDEEGNPVCEDTIAVSASQSQYVVPEDGTNDFPEYPEQGAIRFDKTAVAQGNFSASGIAKVELSMTGVPYTKGSEIDVVLMLDRSRSMNSTRISATIAATEAFVKGIVKNEDGTYNGNRIYIGYFMGEKTYDITDTGNIGGTFTTIDNDNEYNTLISDLKNEYKTQMRDGGTDWQIGLERSESLLEAAKTDGIGNNRKQFCVFMSDGAPGDYRDLDFKSYDHTTGSDWVTNNSRNSEYEYEYYSTRMKGSKGMTIYSVLLGEESMQPQFLMNDLSGPAGETTNDTGSAMSKLNKYYYLVPDANAAGDMEKVFKGIAVSILQAATNVKVEDKIDSHYTMNFSLPSNVTAAEAGGMDDFYIQVLGYTLDANNNRMANPAVLEKILFNSDGTITHTVNGNACGTTCAHVTKTEGKITGIDGTYFDYKVDDKGDEFLTWTAEKLDRTELALEYFVYLDHSAGEATENQVAPGTYNTNEYATITYTNFNGKECQRDFPVPSMTWKGAKVTYTFYLVNADGQPVNRAGKVIPFAEAIYVTNPVTKAVTWNELEGSEDMLAEDLLATAHVPEVYSLYDNQAYYEIRVYETEDTNKNYFIIEGSESVGNKETTKVFNTKAGNRYDDYGAYSATAGSYTSNQSGTSYTATVTTGIDYANTTVAFAVVWKPELVPDTVVVDYGLDVVIDVTTNDALASGVTGVSNTAPNATINTGTYDNSVMGTSADVVLGDYVIGTAKTENLTSVRFSLNKANGMQFTEPAEFFYESQCNYYTYDKDGNKTLNTTHMYSSVTVIPATNVYYEDSFLTLESYTEGSKDDTTKWTREGTTASATQAQDRPGESRISEALDADNNYGYDAAYSSMSKHSLGSAAKITVDKNTRGEATFTFYGTGFDVIGLTSNATGTLTVQVYSGAKAEGNAVKTSIVDTYYGFVHNGFDQYVYTYVPEVKDADGKVIQKAFWDCKVSWVSAAGTDSAPSANPVKGDTYTVYRKHFDPTSSNEPNALYQVPVMKHFGLEYGQYTVKITAGWNDFFDHVNNSTSYDLYLDAIRIYDPTGNESGVANDAYLTDGEAYPEYFEVRDQIIDKGTFDSLDDDEVNGIVFIDGKIAEPGIADYTSYGPNNEVYLAKNDAIAFGLNATAATGKVSKVQLAIKTVGGAGKVEVYGVDADGKITACLNETISTATDMYYDITDLNGKTVVIKSTGDAIISITNVKVTYTQAQPQDPAAQIDVFRTSKPRANAALATMIVAEEPVVPETSEPVEEETEAPETSEPETSEPEETEPEETKPESSKDKLEQALAKAAEQAAKIAQNMKKAAEQAAKALSKLFSRWF